MSNAYKRPNAEFISIIMKRKTFEQLELVKTELGAVSNSDAVRMALELTEKLINSRNNGDSILVGNKKLILKEI